jgi:ethanolamine permease
MLALCLAELSSALPFAGMLISYSFYPLRSWNLIVIIACSSRSGGAYGLTRVTLGTLPGFLVGCFDAYQSMFNAFYSNIALSVMITTIAETDAKWLPAWWLIVYVSYMIIHIVGGTWMWRLLRFMSVGSLGLLLIYILGSIKFARFEEYAPISYPPGLSGNDLYFRGGSEMALKIYPIACWFFLGTESINLASHDAANPKRDLPRAYISTFVTIFCTSVATMFIGASLYPGPTWLPYITNPTSLGYMLIFDIDYQTATILSLPPIYTAGLTYTYYYGSQVRAMGKSGLANSWLGYDVPGFKTPVVALLFGFVVGMLVGLRYYYWEPLPHEDLVSINLLGAAATYCCIFVSFIVFRLYYSSIKREFTSPLGIAGAVWGLLVFLLKFIILSGFESQPAIMIFAIYVVLLVIYYFLVVRKRQVFSEEEKTVLFKAYLIKSKLFLPDLSCQKRCGSKFLSSLPPYSQPTEAGTRACVWASRGRTSPAAPGRTTRTSRPRTCSAASRSPAAASTRTSRVCRHAFSPRAAGLRRCVCPVGPARTPRMTARPQCASRGGTWCGIVSRRTMVLTCPGERLTAGRPALACWPGWKDGMHRYRRAAMVGASSYCRCRQDQLCR